ncbi:hypothetical protein RN001_015258 [Aquatica leii]|uniref:CCHC-type domain-containing protein n=1 Tax=Aquatica leii TaxID=1421715 RepID=A0AAN7PPF3_9COLE|nr:hypothetical protein RN001_015258 [Aquatica leii]
MGETSQKIEEKLLMKQEFTPSHSADILWKQILNRTQGANESIGIYVATMTCLFDRMPISVSNELRLKVLRGNILPFYQERLVLLDINTTTELINYCRKLEETKLKVKEFKPPQEGQLTLEPDLDYNFISAKPKLNPLLRETQLQQEKTPTTLKLCYRCHRPGHLAKTCRVRTYIKCFNCNKPNFTKLTCPDCNRSSGNESKRQN